MKQNEYDYKKMMSDFDLEARRNKILNDIKNKWKTINIQYNERIEEMKIKNENLYKKRDKEFKKKLLKKEMAVQKQIDLKNEKLQEEKKRMEEITKKKCDDVLKNIQQYNEQQEKKRLQLEKNTFLKSNLLYKLYNNNLKIYYI